MYAYVTKQIDSNGKAVPILIAEWSCGPKTGGTHTQL